MKTSIEKIRRRDLIDVARRTFLEHGLCGTAVVRIAGGPVCRVDDRAVSQLFKHVAWLARRRNACESGTAGPCTLGGYGGRTLRNGVRNGLDIDRAPREDFPEYFVVFSERSAQRLIAGCTIGRIARKQSPFLVLPPTTFSV
jgi:hypothetical protein